MSEQYVPTTKQVRLSAADMHANRVARPAFDRWLAAHDAEVKAEAWEEGHSWGWSDAQGAHDVRQEMDRSEWRLCTLNPYHIESQETP